MNTERPDKPALPFMQRLRRLQPYVQPSRWALVLAMVASALGAMTEPLIPAMMKPLLDSGFQTGKLNLWLVPVAVIGLFAVRGFVGFVAQYAMSWSANNGVAIMRGVMFQRLLNAQPALFTEQSASSLTNTLSFETQNAANLLVSSLTTLVKDTLTLVAMLGYLMWLNWKLTLFVAVLFPAVAVVMRVLSKRLHRLTLEGQAAADELAYVVEENVLAWRIVRLHDAAPGQSARFAKATELLRRLSIKSVVAAASMTPVTQVLAAVTLSAVIVAALWQSGSEGGTVGGFAAFITAMLMLISPIKHLSEVAGPITRGLAAFERGMALIDDSPVEVSGSFDPGRSKGHLQLIDVSLQYRVDQDAAVQSVSLDLRPGEAVALVGPSGAGKSSIVNLLPRFIEPSSGTLLLDGTPLSQWNVAALRRQFALVSQDVVLFNDTVAANVSLGATPSSDERARVTEALRGANLLDFAMGLPQGLDTVIGHNGNQMSGGQRQRMAIARAIFKDAPILILDEATSALDAESERLVQDALERLMQGRTSLVIAHRLSTIERADRIVAMDAGRVIEQGTHAELLARGGLYARLHAMQFRI
jgi:ATP-binding cassette, subfamily B, bacterial MsbA